MHAPPLKRQHHRFLNRRNRLPPKRSQIQQLHNPAERHGSHQANAVNAEVVRETKQSNEKKKPLQVTQHRLFKFS